MVIRNCEVYPVRVLTRDGKFKKEVKVEESRKRHWEIFKEESKINAGIKTQSARLRIRAKIKREIDCNHFEFDYSE